MGARGRPSRDNRTVLRRLPVSGFTLAVVLVTTAVVLPLLLTTGHDASYSCRAGSLVEVIHPESEMGADFRREVAFDSGYTCNRTAREQVAIAAGIAVLGAALVAIRRRQRRLVV